MLAIKPESQQQSRRAQVSDGIGVTGLIQQARKKTAEDQRRYEARDQTRGQRNHRAAENNRSDVSRAGAQSYANTNFLLS